MIKESFIFILILLSTINVFSQFVTEKDIVYKGEVLFENVKINQIIVYPSTGNLRLLEKIIEDFGNYDKIISERKGDSIYAWHVTSPKKWLKETEVFYIQQSSHAKHERDENGKLKVDSKGELVIEENINEFTMIFGKNENGKDLFDSKKTYRKAKKYIEKIIENSINKG